MLARESLKTLSAFVRAAVGAERADLSLDRALPSDAGRTHCLIAAEIAGGSFAGGDEWHCPSARPPEPGSGFAPRGLSPHGPGAFAAAGAAGADA